MSDIYVRVGPDDQWHWLGKVSGDITLKTEVTEAWGRCLATGQSYYVEIEP